MSEQTLITVVIPTCNRVDALAECLDRLVPGKQTASAALYEVVVTDDSAGNETREMLLSRFPWVHWNKGPRRGPAANRNSGSIAARGMWLAFTDDDCLPDPGWLAGYANQIAKDPSALVLEGQTSASDQRTRLDQEAPINETGGYLWSCNFCIEKALFRKLDGFDENFPGAAMEDVEFHLRLEKNLQTPTFCPAALVTHPWRPKKGLKFGEIYVASVCYFLAKHPDQSIRFLPKHLIPQFLRRKVKDLPTALIKYRGRGYLRSLVLDLYATLLLVKASKAWTRANSAN